MGPGRELRLPGGASGRGGILHPAGCSPGGALPPEPGRRHAHAHSHRDPRARPHAWCGLDPFARTDRDPHAAPDGADSLRDRPGWQLRGLHHERGRKRPAQPDQLLGRRCRAQLVSRREVDRLRIVANGGGFFQADQRLDLHDACTWDAGGYGRLQPHPAHQRRVGR